MVWYCLSPSHIVTRPHEVKCLVASHAGAVVFVVANGLAEPGGHPVRPVAGGCRPQSNGVTLFRDAPFQKIDCTGSENNMLDSIPLGNQRPVNVENNTELSGPTYRSYGLCEGLANCCHS